MITNLDGMGTTLTGAMFDGVELGLAHIGDSRAYLLRDGKLERLTHDHSWVQSLVDEGKISESEAAYHPHRSLLLKVLNGQPANDPDLTMIEMRAGDRLMLCSDGLCGLVDDPEIESALAIAEIEEAVGQLVAVALAEGGIDNITVIVADVVEAGGMNDQIVLGAAAEREIPTAETRIREEPDDTEDTVISQRPAPPRGASRRGRRGALHAAGSDSAPARPSVDRPAGAAAGRRSRPRHRVRVDPDAVFRRSRRGPRGHLSGPLREPARHPTCPGSTRCSS